MLLTGALALGVSIAAVLPAAAQEPEQGMIDREYPLKALFLYNFASYIKWPDTVFANSQAPFVIGVLGNSPIDETLKQIAATKKIDGRPIVVQHFDSVADIKPCQILFIPRSVPVPQQQAAIAATKDRSVLIRGAAVTQQNITLREGLLAGGVAEERGRRNGKDVSFPAHAVQKIALHR